MAYLGKTPSQAVRSRYYFTASGGETSLSGADDNGNTLTFTDGNYVDVYLNGVLLVAGTDYNTTTANTVGGLTALVASDVVEVVVYDTFSVFSGNVSSNFSVGGNLTVTGSTTLNGSFTSLGIDDNAASTTMTLDGSGNVGIGTAPNNLLEVRGTSSGQQVLHLSNSAGASQGGAQNDIRVTCGGNTYWGDLNINAYNMKFSPQGTEAARFDSSQNFMVGKTSANFATAGATLYPSGMTELTRDGDKPLKLNRLTSDGDIAIFAKDGSTVGSISTEGSRLAIGTGDVGLKFDSGLNQLIPFNISSNAVNDDVITLGRSTSRFKNLYLSGGVYLGGTGSANYLDDYEEGTFTPEVYDAATGGNQITASSTSGSYTKVGNLVTVHFYTYNLDTTGATAANTLFFRNLPFTAAAFGNHGNGLGAVRYHEITTNGGDLTAQTSAGNAHAIIYAMGNDVGDYTIRVQDIGNSGVSDIEFSVSYRAA